MGNRRNKRKWGKESEDPMPRNVRQKLQDSDQGSYFSDISGDSLSSEGDCESDTEKTILIEDEVQNVLCSSAKKLLAVPSVDYEEEPDSLDAKEEQEEKVGSNRILDISLISAALKTAAKCSTCNSSGLCVKEKANTRKGWASTLYIFCTFCEKETSFPTSRHIQDDKTKPTIINRSLVLGMRSIGRGRKAADVLSANLGLPRPVWPTSWAEHTRKLDEVAGETLDVILKTSVQRLKRTKIKLGEVSGVNSTTELTDNELDDLVVNCAASFDGSWKSRGFHSRHGFVSAISADTGEVLDCVYLTSLCRECSKWTGKKDSPEYLDFIAHHFPRCNLNHEGSAQSMEVEGVKRLFERSEDNGLRYTTYVGDGDSRSFSVISRLQPYGPEVDITKEECIGHIQKRMGTRLRALIAKSKGHMLKDGKGLQGAGRLTLARVNAFQRFYGHTLRTYAGDPEMASTITMAMLSHYADPPDHSLCPDGASSWCKFKQDAILGTQTYVPPKQGLPAAVVEHIKPVFTSLSSVDLLRQTQRALTQNANESLHHLIWSLAPKEQFNSSSEVSLAVKLAVMRFNCGLSVTYKTLYKNLGIDLTKSARKSFQSQDGNRLRSAAYASSDEHKEKRAQKNQAKFKDRGFVPSDYKSGAYHVGLKRVAPKCSKCKMPRKGHPRGHCQTGATPLDMCTDPLLLSTNDEEVDFPATHQSMLGV